MSPKATLPHRPVSPAGTAAAQRMDVTGCATQYRFDRPPGSPAASGLPAWSTPPSSSMPDHLVSGNEGKADHVLEVARAASVEGRQIAPADAREQGPQVEPVVPGELRRLGVEETHRADSRSPAGTEDRSDP